MRLQTWPQSKPTLIVLERVRKLRSPRVLDGAAQLDKPDTLHCTSRIESPRIAVALAKDGFARGKRSWSQRCAQQAARLLLRISRADRESRRRLSCLKGSHEPALPITGIQRRPIKAMQAEPPPSSCQQDEQEEKLKQRNRSGQALHFTHSRVSIPQSKFRSEKKKSSDLKSGTLKYCQA